MEVLRDSFTKNGKSQKTKKFYCRFYDHNDARRKLPLFNDRESSQEAARSIERLVNYRASGLDLPPELQKFILHTKPAIKERLAEWDIIDVSQLAAVKSLEEHLQKWEEHLRTKKSGPEYIKTRVQRVRRLFQECGFNKWNDIKATKVAKQLSDWRNCETERMSAQTSNWHLQAARSFCKFMRDVEQCVYTAPLSQLTPENVKADVRHGRRAFTLEEFKYLLGYLVLADTRWHISAADRAFAYQFAAETGLRLSSIRGIDVRSFGTCEGSPAVKVLAGAPNKNPKERWVPFTFELWSLVKKRIEGRRPFEKVFHVPSKNHAAKLVAYDVGAARERWISEAADSSERQRRMDSEFLLYKDHCNRHLDFHSFRHTRAVWLFLHNRAESNEVRDLLGVSSLNLVLRYSESLKIDHAVVHRGPDLTPTPVKEHSSDAGGPSQTASDANPDCLPGTE